MIMETKALAGLIQTIIAAVEKRVPEYLAIEEDLKHQRRQLRPVHRG